MIFNYLSDDKPDVDKIIAAARPYVLAVASILIAALVAFTLFKVIILAKDLVAAGGDPQRRSEIKKAFMCTLIAPIIVITASAIISADVAAFHSDSGGIIT